MKGGGPGPKLTSRILAKIVGRYVAEINFAERHRSALGCRFSFHIDFVYENTHPLVSGTMRINSAALLSSGLYLDAFLSRPHGIVGIDTLNNQVRMTVEIGILNENP